MKLNTAIVISLLTLLIGFSFQKPYLWLPLSILFASFVDLLTRQWVVSDRLGSMRNLSMVIKGLLALVGLYAMIGQVICIGLIIFWFIF